MRILLVEDDAIIGDGLKVGLSCHGFVVDWLTDGRAALYAPQAVPYDAALLDLTLPHVDGLDVLRHWRKEGWGLPVLVLSARGALDQKVEGLDLGADDYLAKPFALEEILARLRALLRRSQGRTQNVLSHGSVVFDPRSRRLQVQGEHVALGATALALVEIFLSHKDVVLSKGQLEEKLYPFGAEVSSNAVEVHVHNIRARLGSRFIRTVHGLGYTLGESP